MAEVSKIITEKQDDPWNGESRPRRQKKTGKKLLYTYPRICKGLAVETTIYIPLLFMFYYSIPSLMIMLITAQK